MDLIFENLPLRFVQARRSAGLTQLEVANLLNIKLEDLKEFEEGFRKLPSETLNEFCIKAGVSMPYLYLSEGRPTDEYNNARIPGPGNSQVA